MSTLRFDKRFGVKIALHLDMIEISFTKNMTSCILGVFEIGCQEGRG